MIPSRTGLARSTLPAVLLLLLECVALAACQTRTNVSATANVPTSYSHVWLTMREVEFNSSATAAPQDSGWQSYPLSSPQTIDLASVTNGALSQFASSLPLPAGTYHQMRVVLSDTADTLTASAQSAGALYNDEVEYTDSTGTAHQVPLEVPNAAQGIGFPIDLTVKTSDKAALATLGCAFGSSSTATTGTAGTTGTLGTGSFGAAGAFGSSGTFGASGIFGSARNPCGSVVPTASQSQCASGYFFDTSTGTCVLSSTPIGTTSAATAGAPPVATTQCALGSTFDPTQGTCMPNNVSNPCPSGSLFGSSSGSPFGSSFGSTFGSSFTSGTSGTSGCTGKTLNTAATIATAIDFDAARALVPYSPTGRYTPGAQPGFVLVPHLTAYDLSQTGTIQGQIGVAALPAGVGDVQVTAETLSTDGSRHIAVKSAPLRADGSFVLYPLSTASGSAAQYDLVIHGAGIGTVIVKAVPVTSGSPSTAASVALTNVVLAGSTAFPVNVAPNSPASARGAAIGFYQTLPGSGEVPYLIAAQPIDPFTGTFDSDQSLPAADLAYGTYASGGATVLAAAPPAEGTATYHIAASAPLYGDGPLGTTVAPAASGTAQFTVAALSLPSGASADTVSGTIDVAAPGKYDKGELLLTQNGTLVAVTPLDAYLGGAQSAATLFSNVPGGSGASTFSDGLYYAEAWVWSSADPTGTLSRQPQSAPIDLRGGSASGVTISIE